MYSVCVSTDIKGSEAKLKVPSGLSAIRQTHWKNSRDALMSCLEGKFPTIQEDSLEIVDHHYLKSNSNILVSLAHTRGAGCAVSVLKDQQVLGIGIDIEKQDRVVKAEIHDKFITGHDKLSEDFLYAWCAKEAAFKASSFYWNQSKTFILKDIIIDLDNDLFEVSNLLRGQLFKESHGDYFVVIAVATLLI